jgi:murein DD-endopeptidase MepM/ murein hydrolase activator NlpD
MQAAGRCTTQQAPRHAIPFRPGTETKVVQAYSDQRTHKEDEAFSIDFKCEPGTVVVATKSGVVWNARDDSNKGCDDPSCQGDANFVILDHGDGTFSEYHHLQHYGALVEPGETVCRGEAVGLCGNTGYSSGPHLHYAVTDLTRRTVPTRLPRKTAKDHRFVVPQQTYISHNKRKTACSKRTYSKLPRDAFAQQGILLDQRLPIVVSAGETTLELSGRYTGPHPHVAIHRKPVDGGSWNHRCIDHDDGKFQTTVSWPNDSYETGYYWLMLSGGSEHCQSPGWSWSYKIRVD